MDQRGFTYIGLLLFVAMTSVSLGIAGEMWSTQSKRDREVELLFVGAQFHHAIAQYYENHPAGQPARFPGRLEDLLDDRRWPTERRHLRRIFIDPMTGSAEWGLIAAPIGGIMGIYSLSEDIPIKRAGFSGVYSKFSKAESYRDWRFEYDASFTDDAEEED